MKQNTIDPRDLGKKKALVIIAMGDILSCENRM
jgi:hypothetical protein